MSDQGTPTRALRLTPAPPSRSDTEDQLSTELDAIITIGRALSHIPDAETRARVMRWAIERFGIDVTPAPEAPGSDLELPADVVPVKEPELPADSLNVDGLSELFPATEDSDPAPAADHAFSLSRSAEQQKPKATAADRLRDALHWMGI